MLLIPALMKSFCKRSASKTELVSVHLIISIPVSILFLNLVSSFLLYTILLDAFLINRNSIERQNYLKRENLRILSNGNSGIVFPFWKLNLESFIMINPNWICNPYMASALIFLEIYFVLGWYSHIRWHQYQTEFDKLKQI